jgi:hypothetical protein
MPPRRPSNVPPPPTIPLPEIPVRGQSSGKQSSGFIHERTQSSPSSLVDADCYLHEGGGPEGRISPRYETPPGTPPPPYQVGSTGNKNSFEVGIAAMKANNSRFSQSSARYNAATTSDHD